MGNIGVVGWYNHGNCGDESYKLSFPKVFPQHQFVFLDEPTLPLDAYILGGGDVVCDDFINCLSHIKRKHLLSVSVSQSHRNISSFDIVAVRDFKSLQNATTSGVRAQYVPDFAFSLNYDVARGKKLIKNQFKGLDLYAKVVVVVVNSHLMPDHVGCVKELFSFQNMASELARAMDSTNASFLFVPFSTSMPWDDRVSSGWVASRCKFWKKNAIVYDVLSVQDTLDIISAADAVISTRLHSSIFSCLSGTPFVDITHNHKNLYFLESNDLIKHSIRYRGAEGSDISNKLNLYMGNKEIIENLNNITQKNRLIIKEFSENAILT